MDLPDLLTNPDFKDNASRLENRDALNDVLNDWLGKKTTPEVMEQLIPAGGVVGPVYDAAKIAEDPHYLAREDIIEVDDPQLGNTKMVGVVPKFSATPGAVEHAGPTLGEHNSHIYGSWLGLEEAQLNDLTGRGVI